MATIEQRKEIIIKYINIILPVFELLLASQVFFELLSDKEFEKLETALSFLYEIKKRIKK